MALIVNTAQAGELPVLVVASQLSNSCGRGGQEKSSIPGSIPPIPQELLAASESCEGVEPVKVYPFMGANGVPQHTSHHLNRRVLGEHNGDKENSNPRRGGGRVPGGRGELAKVHKTNITHNEDPTEMTEVSQTDHSQQVNLQLQRVAWRDCSFFSLDSTNPSLTGL